MKARSRRVATRYVMPWDSAEKRRSRAKAWETLANNLKPCSCWMCGNLRKHHGPRPQEARLLYHAIRDLRDEGL